MFGLVFRPIVGNVATTYQELILELCVVHRDHLLLLFLQVNRCDPCRQAFQLALSNPIAHELFVHVHNNQIRVLLEVHTLFRETVAA